MNYEKKYKEALEKARQFSEHPLQEDSSSIVEYIFPELKESEDEKIRKELIQYIKNWKANIQGKAYTYLWSSDKEECNKLLAWLEKQGEKQTLPKWKYKKDHKPLLRDSDELAKLPKEEFEKQGEKDKVTIKKGEQEPTWSEKDEAGLCDALWAIKQARTIAKDENDMGNLWYAENWLKSLKQRIGG